VYIGNCARIGRSLMAGFQKNQGVETLRARPPGSSAGGSKVSGFSSAVRPLFTAHHENATYSKVTWRLVPFLFICYTCSYLDRVNVGFAKLQMQTDLHLSDAAFGFGVGVLFLGYFLFEIPSNLLLHRFGARRWIARIMVTWAVLSAATAFVSSPAAFYTMRFLLGVAEAGFFPGMVLYLTYWYPAKRRARIMALFMTAIPASAIIGAPISGWILHALSGRAGLSGWQWLFLVEGVPSLLIGIAVLFYLEDKIDDANWLTDGEKLLLERNIETEGDEKQSLSIRQVFKDKRVWLLTLIYFCISMGTYGLGFWLPTLIQASGVQSILEVGILSAVPFGVGTISMIVFARSADRNRERRWHLVVALLLGAMGMCLSAVYSASVIPAVFSLTLAGIGIMALAPIFWSIPTAFLSGVAAATGIALINSISNLAGFFSPYMVSWIQQRTQSTNGGLYVISGFLAFAAVLVLTTVPARLMNK
jgi:D-galactonate transporter